MSPDPSPSADHGCPAPDELIAYVGGELASVRTREIGEHLARCRRCEQILAKEGSGPGTAGTLARETPTTDDSGPAEGPARPLAAENATVRSGAPRPSLRQLGRFQIIEQLGQGGMGAVYRAFHPRLKRQVALKVLSPGRVPNPQAVARFEREMQAVGRLDHPHIVRAMDADEADGVHFLVMELVEGIDLSRLVRNRGPLPVAEACELVRQAALGLQYVHEHQMVHRDIKPSNLILTPEGKVKILDLGLALLHGDEAEEELTGTDQMLGTVDYMAPEQRNNTHQVDIRADLYSLGCTLYKLLTGEAPFAHHPGQFEKLRGHAEGTPRPVTEFRPDVPEELAAVLARLLAKRREDRYDTPQEVVRALEPFAAGASLGRPGAFPGDADEMATEKVPTPTAQPKSAPAKPASAPPKRRRRAAALAGAAALVLLAVGGAVFLHQRSTPSARDNLLEAEPVALRVPEGTKTQYDARLHEFHLDTSAPCLFQVGAAPTFDYDFEVKFHRNNFVGRMGVFVGHQVHKTTPDGTEKFVCFTLGSPNPFIDAPEVRLSLFSLAFDRRTGNSVEMEMLDTGIKPLELHHDHWIGIQVRRGAFHKLFINDLDVTHKLAALPADQAPRPADLVGAVGVFGYRGAATFKLARLRLHPAEEQ